MLLRIALVLVIQYMVCRVSVEELKLVSVTATVLLHVALSISRQHQATVLYTSCVVSDMNDSDTVTGVYWEISGKKQESPMITFISASCHVHTLQYSDSYCFHYCSGEIQFLKSQLLVMPHGHVKAF